jgi:hypothetical protein
MDSVRSGEQSRWASPWVPGKWRAHPAARLFPEQVLERADECRIRREPAEVSRGRACDLERQPSSNGLEFRARLRQRPPLSLFLTSFVAFSLRGQTQMERIGFSSLPREARYMLTIFDFLLGAASKFGTQPRRLCLRGSIQSRRERLDLSGVELVRAVLVQCGEKLAPLEPAHRGNALAEPLCNLRTLPGLHAREPERAKLDRQGRDDLVSCDCLRARPRESTAQRGCH